MKYIFILALSFCSICTTAQTAKEAKIKKLMEITGSGNLGKQVITNIITSYKETYPNVNPKYWEEVVKEADADEFVRLLTPIYAKYYTEEDLDGLIKFYETPLGKKVIATLPGISAESMAVGQKWGEELAQKIFKKLEAAGEPLTQ